MVVLSPERNKPFKWKTILLFCPPDWELTERGLYMDVRRYGIYLRVFNSISHK